MRKLCFIPIIQSHKWGGSEEYWYLVAKEALKEGHELLIVVEYTGKFHPKFKELKSSGAELLPLKIGEKPNFLDRVRQKIQRSLKSHPKVPKEYIELMETLKSFDADIVLINQGGTFNIMECPIYLWMLKNHDKPYSLFSHNYFEQKVYPYNYLQRIRKMLTYVERFYFISERNMQIAKRALAYDAFPQSEVLKNLCKFGLVEPLPLPDVEEVHFASVARLDCHNKGQDMMIQALANDRWKKRSWKLNVYGKGQDEQYLKDLAEYVGLKDRVVFHGFSADIQEVWKQNHLLLLSSSAEGTSQAIIEAMMCGRPVVATDVGDSGRMVQNNKTGFLAEAATVELFDRALEQAWQARGKWGELGKNANQFIRAYIDPEPGKTLLNKLLKS